MEDFGVLWIWGFCGDSHRCFCGHGDRNPILTVALADAVLTAGGGR